MMNKGRKWTTDHHGFHGLSDTPCLKFIIGMFVPDSFEVKERTTKVFSKENKSATVGE